MRADYAVMDPTGNVTILVNTPTPVPLQPGRAAALLAFEPEAEQVGFLSPGDAAADLALRMAGGEFCGNAAMSAAALYCMERGLRDGRVKVRVSGAELPVSVQVTALPDASYACAVDMPRPESVEMIGLSLDGETHALPLVRFAGICHLILPGDFDRAAAERAAKRWCAKLGAAALGLMLLDEKAERMTPLVYVPGGDTLYWERSCASGTAAAGAYLAWKTAAPAALSLRQPGGILRVEAVPVGQITLHGAVKLLHVGELPPESP